MTKWARPGVLFAALVLLWPTAAHAQASLAGVVKDASGGVLPGVTVEAASSALIEKVRSVVTDDTGQYKIVDLRPGSYSVWKRGAGLLGRYGWGALEPPLAECVAA